MVKGKVELAWFVDQIIPVGDYLRNWRVAPTGILVSNVAPPCAWPPRRIPTTRWAADPSTTPTFPVQPFAVTNCTCCKPSPTTPQTPSRFPKRRGRRRGKQGEKPEPEPNPNLFLTVVDLAKLPALSVISEVALVDEHMGWNNQFKANWPSDGSLLWSNEGGYRYWGWPWIMDDIGGMPDMWWPGYGGGAGQLICFDVADPAKPALASNINLSVEEEEENGEDKKRRRYANRWNFSEAILNKNNLVYLSSQHSEYIRIEEEEEKPNDDDEEEEEDPTSRSKNRSQGRSRFRSRAVTGSHATSCTSWITQTRPTRSCATRWPSRGR